MKNILISRKLIVILVLFMFIGMLLMFVEPVISFADIDYSDIEYSCDRDSTFDEKDQVILSGQVNFLISVCAVMSIIFIVSSN